MNLETLIDATEQKANQANAVRFQTAEKAIGMFRSALPLRGKLPNVMGLGDAEMMTKANLDWKTVTLPVAAVGRRENRVIEGYQAIVRSDNGKTLAITSDKFKAHQNSDIMKGIQDLAAAGDATICYAGSTDGGRKVVALAKLDGEFSLPNKTQNSHFNSHAGGRNVGGGDDKTHLFACISGGHEVGTPFKVRGLALRRWCENGAFFCVQAASSVVITHRRPLRDDLEAVRAAYDSMIAEFAIYSRSAKRMIETPADREQNLLFVAELLQPGIVAKMQAEFEIPAKQDVFEMIGHNLRGKQVLDQMVRESDHTRSISGLLNAIVEQEGSNGDNLWNAYNSVTWHVDHRRGRTDETGVDSALFGPGAQLKERALEVAVTLARA